MQEAEAAIKPKARSEIETIDSAIRQTKAGIERYYSACEAGRLPEERFANRIDALEERLEAP